MYELNLIQSYQKSDDEVQNVLNSSLVAQKKAVDNDKKASSSSSSSFDVSPTTTGDANSDEDLLPGRLTSITHFTLHFTSLHFYLFILFIFFVNVNLLRNYSTESYRATD